MPISPVEKALAIRANWIRKARRPHSAAHQRLRPALDLVYLVEKHHMANENAIQEARRNLVIALAASFEIYWRETFRIAIDRERTPPDRFRSLGRVSLSIADASTIVGKRLTLGELVTCCHTFQSIDAVNRLATEMLEKDFFNQFKEREFVIAPADLRDKRIKSIRVTGSDIFDRHVSGVARCLTLRHALAHDWPSHVKISRKDAIGMHGSISTWNIFLGASLQWQLLEAAESARTSSRLRATVATKDLPRTMQHT